MVAQRKNKNGTKKDIIQQTRLWRAQPPHLVWYELSHSCVLFFRAPQSQVAQKFG